MEEKFAVVRAIENSKDIVLVQRFNINGKTLAYARREALKHFKEAGFTSPTWIGWFDDYKQSLDAVEVA